jgi:Protein of unknown function (DUF1071)
MKTYQEVRLIDVSKHVEKKDNLTYLSWAWAWDEFKQAYPDAEYEVLKNPQGLPYFEDSAGAMVYTRVTANNQTHEMWLPVMDGRNKAMKREPYTVKTFRGRVEVSAYTMFDINKTLMRCLVKNLAMFGLGLYIYAGEDLPEKDEEAENPKAVESPSVKASAFPAFPGKTKKTAQKPSTKPEIELNGPPPMPPPPTDLDFYPSDLDGAQEECLVSGVESLKQIVEPVVPFGKNKGVTFSEIGSESLAKSIWAAKKGLDEKAEWVNKVGPATVQHFIATATAWIDEQAKAVK